MGVIIPPLWIQTEGNHLNRQHRWKRQCIVSVIKAPEPNLRLRSSPLRVDLKPGRIHFPLATGPSCGIYTLSRIGDL
jgi:hypothetical protein